MTKLKVLTYLPHYVHTYGIGYAAHSLALGMNTADIESDMFSIISDLAAESQHVKQAIPIRLVYKLLSKFVGNDWITRFTEYRFRKLAKKYDLICLWPGCSIETYRYLKKLGKTIIIEFINCHVVTSKSILDNETMRLGLSDTHLISNEKIREERERLSLSDFVISPSPQVTKSLLENNVSQSKIIESSYGLGEHQLLVAEEKNERSPVIFIFVGSVIMRKGVHLLLDYWTSANLQNARLKIIGKVDPSLLEIIEQYQSNPTIEFIAFTHDLDKVYQSADVFIMPSLEEGSPLVTYLALGAGLPCIVSPMGGDGVVVHEQNGIILEPKLKQEWIGAITNLAGDSSLRANYAKVSKQLAKQYLWKEVAFKRANAIKGKLEGKR